MRGVLASVFALLTAICCGINPILVRWGLAGTSNASFGVFIGLAVAVPIYVLLLPFWGGLHWESVTLPALVGFILGGLFGAGIGRGWQFAAIRQIGAPRAVAIKNSAPLFSTLLAVALLGEVVTLLHWAAILTIIGGLLLVSLKRSGEPDKARLHRSGVLMALGAALSYGIRPLFLKFGLDAADLPLTAALVGAVAAIAPYGFTLATRGGLSLGMRQIPTRSVWLFAIAGVLQTFGFLALTLALSGGEVSVVYPITATAPVVTLLCSYVLLRRVDRLTGRDVVGILAVVLGVAVLSAK